MLGVFPATHLSVALRIPDSVLGMAGSPFFYKDSIWATSSSFIQCQGFWIDSAYPYLRAEVPAGRERCQTFKKRLSCSVFNTGREVDVHSLAGFLS